MYKTLSAPITVQVELTTACNCSCMHCYNHWRHESSNVNIYMTDAVLDRVVVECDKNKVFQVTLTGGEVLMKKEFFFNAIERFLEKGIGVSVNSNLKNFTYEDGLRLKRLGIPGILTSVCSYDQKKHDHIVQSEGSFDMTMTGIANAIKAGLSVGVSMVVTTMNLDEVVQTGKFLKENGVNQFFATKASPPLNSIDFRKYMIDRVGLVKVLDDLIYLRNHEDLEVGILECYPLCGYKDANKYEFAVDRRCSAGTTTCTIGADGKIRPCSHSDDDYGSISSVNLYDAWMFMNSWRDGSKLPSECKECEVLDKCSGGCRIDSEYCNGDISSLDPYAEVGSVKDVILREKSFPVVLLTDRFIVSECMKIRNEGFGVLCSIPASVGSPVLLTNDTYELITELEGEIFSPMDLVEKHNVPEGVAVQLTSLLYKDKLLVKA